MTKFTSTHITPTQMVNVTWFHSLLFNICEYNYPILFQDVETIKCSTLVCVCVPVNFTVKIEKVWKLSQAPADWQYVHMFVMHTIKTEKNAENALKCGKTKTEITTKERIEQARARSREKKIKHHILWGEVNCMNEHI